MYACPNCKSDLVAYRCVDCGFEALLIDGLPVFFTGSTISNRYKEIGEFYDNLYGAVENVWQQVGGRGPEFLNFVGSLVAQKNPARCLDIGCGEGFLLAALNAPEKYGLDISRQALKAATGRTEADLCLGFGEQLPYPNEHFDAVTSIGVMTHLIDDLAATREIHRVLCPAGRYIVGIYLKPSLAETIAAKLLEYIYPRPRPFDLFQWAISRAVRSIKPEVESQDPPGGPQPIRRFYTSKQLEAVLKKSGFVVEELITKIKRPSAPLPGQHFRIYILRKV